VQINCGSGMQSIDAAYRYIREGVSDLVLAGGAEALSYAPLVFNRNAVKWYARLFAARGLGEKLSAFLGFRPSMLTPVIGLERGLTDPITNLNMGQTAELVGHLFHITRRQADEYAAESQLRLAAAQKNGYLAGEVEPAFARDGTLFDHDDGVRPDSSADALAKLKPAFHAQGTVTAGTSSQTSDGAAATILMDAARAKELGLQPLGRLVTYATAGCLPEEMGIGPIYSIPKALRQAGLTLDEISLIECNEAFAAQTLAIIRALGIDPARVNVNGGAIALGHPLGCTGAKLTATLLSEMRRREVRYGMVTMCAGGGMGATGIFELL